jgi:hypothetical protein
MLYLNTPENAERIGWPMIPEHVYGDKDAKYVYHCTMGGFFFRTDNTTFFWCYVYGIMFIGNSFDEIEKKIDDHERTDRADKRAHSYTIHRIDASL